MNSMANPAREFKPVTVTVFALVPTTVSTDCRLTTAEHRVLGALFSFRSSADDWLVWPSRARIGERSGITNADHVSRILGRLKGKGWIRIKRRRGSSLYHLAPDGRQSRPAHYPADLDLRTTPQMEETKGEEIKSPLTPQGGRADEAIPTIVQVETWAPAIQGSPPQDPGGQPATEAGPPIEGPTTEPSAEKPQGAVARTAAAQRVIAHLNTKTDSQLPTAPHSAHVRRAARRLRHHSEAEITQVIDAKAREFRHPAALLKPSLIESVLSDLRKAAEERAKRLQRERECLPIRPVRVNPQAAQGALSAMRQALGVREGPRGQQEGHPAGT